MLKKVSKYVLFTILALVSAIAVLSFWPLAEPLQQKRATQATLITNVQVVDVLANRVHTAMDIVVENGRIRSVSKHEARPALDSLHVVEGDGRYVISGLWDMHNHFAFQTAPQMSMPLYIAAGVTNVRDMQGIVSINHERHAWKERIDSGKLLGPRIIAFADEMVGGNYDEQDLEALVDRSAASPYTFIKVYSGVMPERFFELARLSDQHGVDIAGHYPNSINPVSAANAGQRSFEHGLLFLNHAFSGADTLRLQYKKYYSGTGMLERPLKQRNKVFTEFDEARFDELISVMVNNDTYFCPTHITRRFEAMAHDEAFRADARLKYIPPMVNLVWQDDADGEATWEGEAGREHLKKIYQRGLELTGLAHKKGVKVIAGSDSLDPYSFPGLSLHDELVELVKAGLTPSEALAAATITPAEYFSVESDFGSVEPGKVADIVFLNANPLEDITHVRDINAVMYNGAYYSSEELTGMLNYVEDNNSGVKGVIMSLRMFWRLMRDNRH